LILRKINGFEVTSMCLQSEAIVYISL